MWFHCMVNEWAVRGFLSEFLQTTSASALPPAAHPHRPPAVAAPERAAGTGTGRRGAAAREPRYGQLTPRTSPIRKPSPGAPAPRACRPRVGIPATGPLANVAGFTAPCCAIHRPAPRKPMDAAPSARRASPSARRRSRRRTGGRRARGRGGRHRAREARHATQGGSIARPNCATGVQAAGRHPGEVAARRRSW
jgi:hypothetical protein